MRLPRKYQSNLAQPHPILCLSTSFNHLFSTKIVIFYRQHASDVRKNVANYHLSAKSESSSAASSSVRHYKIVNTNRNSTHSFLCRFH